MSFVITEAVEVGRNQHGYRFAAVQIDQSGWVPVAISDSGMFLMCPDNWVIIGTPSLQKAVHAAIVGASDPGGGYGGIEAWHPGVCRVCGCTESDCSVCVDLTGFACSWVNENFCSACESLAIEGSPG